jgi:hypothetical protein
VPDPVFGQYDLDLSRLIAMLHHRALPFIAPDKLGDPSEGVPSKPVLSRLYTGMPEEEPDRDELRTGHSDNALDSLLRGHRSASDASRASSIAGAAFIASTIGFSCGQLIHLLRHRIRFIQMERDALERSTSPA